MFLGNDRISGKPGKNSRKICGGCLRQQKKSPGAALFGNGLIRETGFRGDWVSQWSLVTRSNGKTINGKTINGFAINPREIRKETNEF